MIEKILHVGKKGVGKQVWFVPNTVGGSGGVTIPGNASNFYPHLSLETVISSI